MSEVNIDLENILSDFYLSYTLFASHTEGFLLLPSLPPPSPHLLLSLLSYLFFFVYILRFFLPSAYLILAGLSVVFRISLPLYIQPSTVTRSFILRFFISKRFWVTSVWFLSQAKLENTNLPELITGCSLFFLYSAFRPPTAWLWTYLHACCLPVLLFLFAVLRVSLTLCMPAYQSLLPLFMRTSRFIITVKPQRGKESDSSLSSVCRS